MNAGREKAALKRDLVWSLLWQLTHEGAAAHARDVFDAWRDGRYMCGIACEPDWIGNEAYFKYVLDRLVADGRAMVSRAKERHPLYVAVVKKEASHCGVVS